MKQISIAMAAAVLAAAAQADVVTTPTTDGTALAAALQPANLRIISVEVVNGLPAQFGTYSNFSLAPITIGDGVVLGSGDISSLGPLVETQDPSYDPASPPARVVNAMGSGTTKEFSMYGSTTGAIANFSTAWDVAAIKVTFELPVETNVKFDFIFGSVEFPYYTSSFTDAFLVFLDGFGPMDQVCYDANGSAIQVGQSFANLVTTADRNTAFSSPHGLIKSLTTTTPVMEAGEHVLWFEVADVNDEILDSAVFITNLRAEAGNEGTDETGGGGCEADFDADDFVGASDLATLLADWGGSDFDLDGDNLVGGSDLALMLASWGACS